MSSCAPNLPIVLGDARLTFAHEPDRAYDLIIVDAYSSDAIPVHLATAEAMALYKSKLAPHGVVLMHISNRHLDLKTVVEGIADANGLKTWFWSSETEESDDNNFIFGSDVAIAAEDIDGRRSSRPQLQVLRNQRVGNTLMSAASGPRLLMLMRISKSSGSGLAYSTTISK